METKNKLRTFERRNRHTKQNYEEKPRKKSRETSFWLRTVFLSHFFVFLSSSSLEILRGCCCCCLTFIFFI